MARHLHRILGRRTESLVGTIDADELDMAVIREAGDCFLKRPEVRPVCLAATACAGPSGNKIKSHKKKEAER